MKIYAISKEDDHPCMRTRAALTKRAGKIDRKNHGKTEGADFVATGNEFSREHGNPVARRIMKVVCSGVDCTCPCRVENALWRRSKGAISSTWKSLQRSCLIYRRQAVLFMYRVDVSLSNHDSALFVLALGTGCLHVLQAKDSAAPSAFHVDVCINASRRPAGSSSVVNCHPDCIHESC